MASIRWREINKDGQIFVEEIHKITVYTFTVGDVDDPEIYAAQPILEWQNSEAGQFIMNNAVEKPMFHRQLDISVYGYKFAITAELEKKKLSEFYLRFGKHTWK